MASPLVLVLTAVCFSVTGEFFLSKGMKLVGELSLSTIGSQLPTMLGTWQLWAGFGSIAVGAAFWLAALSRADLSWAYPLLALGYVVTLLLAPLILREQIPMIRWVGGGLIVLGVYLISRS